MPASIGGVSIRGGLLVIVLVGLAAVPLVVGNPYLLHLFIMSMVFALLALSWNLINGYGGIFTFGHQAFFGLGAYTSALLAIHSGLSPWVTMWGGGVVAAAAGILIGLPVLRIRSVAHVAIVTLAFAEIVKLIVSNLTDLTRGTLGLSGIPPFTAFSITGLGEVSFGAGDGASYYYLAWALLSVTLVGLAWLVNSRTGLALKAIRDSEQAADSLGIRLVRYKMLAFVVSSFIAGVTGAFYAHYLHILTPESAIGIHIMITILVITLIGGIGTVLGPVAGAFLVTFGLEELRVLGDYRLMIYGALLVIFVIFLPRGLARLGEIVGLNLIRAAARSKERWPRP
ncbi:MAG: branched-chain amino acid ABC transporter permease [Salinisphaera sp.]|jgi:branched-chain amino acid transport system permease protein|nr:branched-chain amino acid ABC transporter permease [Salinisphaera sp.]